MDDRDLISRAVQTFTDYAAVGNEDFDAAGARFVRNRETPLRFDANHVSQVRAESAQEIAALFRRMEREFAGFRHRAIDTDPLTPPRFLASLDLEGGYARSDSLILVLEGKLKTRASKVDVRAVETDEQWHALGELDKMWWRSERPAWDHNVAVMDQSLVNKQRKYPDVRFYLAYIDDHPRAFFGAYPGENGVGQVEDLYTHPRYRHRGLATALMRTCVADARDRGAGPIIISCDPGDTPKFMYESMGFRPLMLLQHYLNRITQSERGGA